jgi:hypothetical protein
MLSLDVSAQEETEADQTTGTSPEENEDQRRIKSVVGNILLTQISDELDYLYKERVILDIPEVRIDLSQRFGAPIIKVKSPKIKLLPTIGFSTTIPDPYIGSPAYEVTQVIRHSLNIDPITGKYYWEW